MINTTMTSDLTPTKIVFLDRKALPCALPEFNFPHELVTYDFSEDHQLISRIKDANIVITNKCRLTREVLKNAPQLKLITLTATGYNNVDLIAATAHGIKVSNVTGYSSAGVAQHALTLILNLLRKTIEYQQAAREGIWQDSPVFCVLGAPLHELNGLTLGIIGNGEIARTLVQYAKIFDIKVILLDRKGATTIRKDYVAFEAGLQQADIISIHCPLTPETTNLIGLNEFKQMKQSSIIINTARGGIINETDLYTALKAGIIAGAGLDVLTEEPPKNGNILLDPSLTNLIITPHIAWMGQSSLKTLAQETVHNIHAFQHAAPRNLVN